MNAQGSRPRLESGAIFFFLDPAGLYFPIRDYFSGVPCLPCDRGSRKYRSSASAEPSKNPSSNCWMARSRIASRLVLGRYTYERPGLRRATQPRFSSRSSSVITVVYARILSFDTALRTSCTVPSPNRQSACRQVNSSGGGSPGVAAGRLKSCCQVLRAVCRRRPMRARSRAVQAPPVMLGQPAQAKDPDTCSSSAPTDRARG
jgi:hypothetical protein